MHAKTETGQLVQENRLPQIDNRFPNRPQRAAVAGRVESAEVSRETENSEASATGERSVGRQRLERARLDHDLGAMVDVANSREEDQPFFWQGDLEGVRARTWKANQHSKAAVAA
jgi:hypothetical protein